MKFDKKIVPHLWFNADAEEAVDFYVSLFANSSIGRIARYGDAGPGPQGTVMSIGFTLNGQDFAAINGGPHQKFNAAVSFLIWCDTQDEIDALYDRLLEGGKPHACGWLEDRFGLAWQVNYSGIPDMMSGPDAAASSRAMQAMMTMRKIDVQRLKNAYAGG